MAEFTWLPSIGFNSSSTPRVRTAKYGDGYVQRVPDGINNIDQTWELQFQSQEIDTANSIENFLAARGGSVSFSWLPPGETSEVRVICPKWSKNYESSITRSISATFERVYGD